MVLPRENKIIPETAQHAFSRELFFQCISFCISFPLNPAGWGSGGEGGSFFSPLILICPVLFVCLFSLSHYSMSHFSFSLSSLLKFTTCFPSSRFISLLPLLTHLIAQDIFFCVVTVHRKLLWTPWLSVVCDMNYSLLY